MNWLYDFPENLTNLSILLLTIISSGCDLRVSLPPFTTNSFGNGQCLSNYFSNLSYYYLEYEAFFLNNFKVTFDSHFLIFDTLFSLWSLFDTKVDLDLLIFVLFFFFPNLRSLTISYYDSTFLSNDISL